MSDVSALNLESGDLIGGYTLISRLGAGAMGSVWRVQDDGGQEYAMKILRDSLADDTVPNAAQSGGTSTGSNDLDMDDPDVRERVTARERLRREAMALRKVNHPGVCGIVDMELDDSVAFIVTELIEGRNLRDDVRVNGRYTGDDLERLARKLIAAVKAVHAAGIVHRDIKPTNVMVSASGPVLVDFGIAMTGGESHVTRTGLVMGTPGFIAPEIIDGAESDAMTDWWSTASVLAFAATGSPVFGTKPMMAVLERAAAGNANLTGLPAGTMAAFRAALNPDRNKRCTPDELLHAIAIDALNPRAWEDAAQLAAQSSASAPAAAPIAGGDGANGTEVVRPFESAAAGNPRLLWRDESNETSYASNTARNPSITSTMPAEEATTLVSSPSSAHASAHELTLSSEVAGTQPTADQTAILQPEQTAILQPSPAEQTAVLLPTAVSQPPADETAPTTAIAGAPLEPTQVSPIPPLPAIAKPMPGSVPPFLQEVAASQPTPPPPALPQSQSLPQSSFANPVAEKRNALYARGALPLWLLTIPVATLAASMPVVAIIAMTILLWLLLTVGYSTVAQLDRESRHGGERQRFDGVKRAASLPWHALKSLGLAVPRALVIIVTMTVLAALCTVTLALPVMRVDVQLVRWVIAIPFFDEVPLSLSGFTLGAGAAIGWLLSTLTARSAIVRIGAGAVRGASDGATDSASVNVAISASAQSQSFGSNDSNASSSPHDRRRAVLLIAWGVSLAIAVASLVITAPIDWWPLVS